MSYLEQTLALDF
jgi:hypothetical protein